MSEMSAYVANCRYGGRYVLALVVLMTCPLVAFGQGSTIKVPDADQLEDSRKNSPSAADDSFGGMHLRSVAIKEKERLVFRAADGTVTKEIPLGSHRMLQGVARETGRWKALSFGVRDGVVSRSGEFVVVCSHDVGSLAGSEGNRRKSVLRYLNADGSLVVEIKDRVFNPYVGYGYDLAKNGRVIVTVEQMGGTRLRSVDTGTPEDANPYYVAAYSHRGVELLRFGPFGEVSGLALSDNGQYGVIYFNGYMEGSDRIRGGVMFFDVGTKAVHIYAYTEDVPFALGRVDNSGVVQVYRNVALDDRGDRWEEHVIYEAKF